ncbi:ABC transporter permease [Spirillospora sp. NPDC048911]|uniref:ABC transporter permease n=1 Tax=Spirillospora sp. NPDC048911 TaxID=3364527 RepID=UPI00371D511F
MTAAVPGRLTPAGRFARGAAGVAILVAASEALGRAGIVHRDYLPPASVFLRRAAELAADTAFLGHLRATLTAWALGLLIAVAFAVPLGVVLGSVPVINTGTRAVVEFLRPIPSVALIPLAGLILGAGLQMKLTLIVYAATWPILFNTMYGLNDVDPLAKDTLRSFGFGPLPVLYRVSLPYAAPFIATGIRLAAAVALILAVSTEILAGWGEGVGVFIAQAQTAPGGIDDMLAATVWTGTLGLVINAVLIAAERRLFRRQRRIS